MTAPTPIHRDPEHDGEDYGCFTDEANAKVAAVVATAEQKIRDEFSYAAELIQFVHSHLKGIGDGAGDTVVLENVFQALLPVLNDVGIHLSWPDIYR